MKKQHNDFIQNKHGIYFSFHIFVFAFSVFEQVSIVYLLLIIVVDVIVVRMYILPSKTQHVYGEYTTWTKKDVFGTWIWLEYN